MALTVVVRSSAFATAPRISFDSPRVIIGRGEGCEVRLPDPSVSHRHASIRQRGSDYIVMDEGSTTGTFVGSVRLSPQAPRVIKSGDLVRVGRVWLELVIEQVPPTKNTPLATRELALALVSEALGAEGSPTAPWIEVREGPSAGTTLSLDEFDRAYVIGRMQGADMNLDDDDLSRRHVEVYRRGDKIFVRDLGSKNGSQLGEQKLPPNQDVPWPESESVILGRCVLRYEDPVARALVELEAAADEKIPGNEPIAPPKGVAAPAVPPTRTTESTRGSAPIKERPRRGARDGDPEGWTIADVGVVLLAIVVLAISFLALVWITRN